MYHDAIHAVSALPGTTRQQRFDGLNQLFRAGVPPRPALDGAYAGSVDALDIAPVLTPALERLTSLWMPWKGKHLNSADSSGDNIFSQSSRTVFRITFPFYRKFTDFEAGRFRAFTFHTSIRAGKVDPDRQVLAIDYDLPENPALSIRRIVDELVQIDDGLYLGKIHLKWWWGTWKMLGYFSLRRHE